MNRLGLGLDLTSNPTGGIVSPVVSGYSLWLTAQDNSEFSTTVVGNDSFIESWTDRSVNEYSIGKLTDGTRPKLEQNILNNKPGVRFSNPLTTGSLGTILSASQKIQLVNASTGTFTMFVVVSGINATSAHENFIVSHYNYDAGASVTERMFNIRTGWPAANDTQQLGYIYTNTGAGSGATGPITRPGWSMIFAIRRQAPGGRYRMYRNADMVRDASAGTGNTGTTHFHLGGQPDVFAAPTTISNSLNGYIHEVIIYDRDLTDQEMSDTWTSLGNTWNISLTTKPTLLSITDSLSNELTFTFDRAVTRYSLSGSISTSGWTLSPFLYASYGSLSSGPSTAMTVNLSGNLPSNSNVPLFMSMDRLVTFVYLCDNANGNVVDNFTNFPITQNYTGTIAYRDAIGTPSTSNVSSYSTSTFSTSPNSLLLCAVVNSKASAPDTVSTISGQGLTWEEITTTTFGTIAAPTMRLTVYRAMGPSPTSAGISVTFPANQTGCYIQVTEIFEADTSGSNGSGSVVQFITNRSDSSTTPTATLSSPLASSSNGMFGIIVSQSASTQNTESTAFKYHQSFYSTPTVNLITTGRTSSSDNSINTTTATTNWCAFGIEIKKA